MRWRIRFGRAFDAWDERVDLEIGERFGPDIIAAMDGWSEVGSRDEAEYDETTLTYSCRIPGTPITAIFVYRAGTDRPAAEVLDFY